tara:strand:- start:739 stop:1992 length:1254 start_codon:yes stop_codon:yes gene_type:complete
MIKNLTFKYNAIENSDKLYFLILSFFPLSLILGNLIINIFIILFAISFIINIQKNIFFLKNKVIYFFIFFLFSLIINLFFSLNFENSFPRVIKIFSIILLTVETIRIFKRYDANLLKNVFLVWSFVFVIVLLDCIYEVIFGYNTLGFSTPIPGRIASFFGEELIAGAFVFGFALFFIGYLINNNSNKFIIGICILSIIVTSLLIGERSNFLKLLISIIIFSFFVFRTSYLKMILFFLISMVFIVGILNFSKNYKYRYIDQMEIFTKENGIIKYYKSSQYGAHYNVAMKIFIEYPLFGVGIKNFRFESGKEKYTNNEFKATDSRQATHPHQVHLEFLSETGIFGYFSFLIFIIYSLFISFKNYLRYKNIFQLSSIIFILTSLLPLLPSGSFLSTFNSGIFWINYIIMIGMCKNLKFKL